MVHVNSALRLAQYETYPQRNTSRQRSATASADSATSQSAAPSTPAASASTTAASSNTAADDFRALFTSTLAPAAPATPGPTPSPTAESVFGANPWITTAGGTAPNGATYSYSPSYFATPATAAKVAQMVGGKVVAFNAIAGDGPFIQNQPNQMVQLPNGRMINAGLIASFYGHGYPQSYINTLIANEVNPTAT
jgi:hypothetical protein